MRSLPNMARAALYVQYLCSAHHINPRTETNLWGRFARQLAIANLRKPDPFKMLFLVCAVALLLLDPAVSNLCSLDPDGQALFWVVE